MKFKSGDKVRVKPNLVSGRSCGGITFVPSMCRMRGQKVTICIVGRLSYRIDECGFLWSDEMLEPVTPPQHETGRD